MQRHAGGRWRSRVRRGGLLCGLILLAAGCATQGPLPAASDIEPPFAWSNAPADDAALWPAPEWWDAFGSEELSALVLEARVANPDLAAAFARVLQAGAQARIAGAPLWPTVDLSADAGRQGAFGAGADSSFGLSIGAAYEVDLWGGRRADLAAARALVAASELDRETVALTLTANVASAYFDVLSLRERLEIARLNLEVAEGVLALVEARVRFGAASPLELAQQRAAVAGQRAALPLLEQAEREARAGLAVLLGRTPQDLDVSADGLEGVGVPPVVAGLPSELLARRPDIRREEMRLAAASADVAVARAALLPDLRLTASAGFRSAQLSSLFDGDPLWNALAGLVAPIFNAGRLAAGEDFAEARHEELLQSYRATVLGAFAEVDTTLGALESLAVRARWLDEALAEATTALDLAERRYRAGAEGLLTVLDAQRTFYQARDERARLRLERLQAIVALYRALGGGWRAGDATAGVAGDADATG